MRARVSQKNAHQLPGWMQAECIAHHIKRSPPCYTRAEQQSRGLAVIRRFREHGFLLARLAIKVVRVRRQTVDTGLYTEEKYCDVSCMSR